MERKITMSIDANTKQRFFRLRRKLFKAIGEQLADDPHCKSYEGTFEITQWYPNYFEDEACEEIADHYVITLHCYVIGPGRHYDWIGKTFAEALDKAEKDINRWLGVKE